MTTYAQDIASVELGEHAITMEEFVAVARFGARVRFTASYTERVTRSRSLIEQALASNQLIYGVTTGFGDNVRHVIAPSDAAELQRNIVRSHAVSVGGPLPTEVVRAIQLMELVGLGQGYSGISLPVLSLIRDLLNNGVTPYVPGQGSVGYLSPEAHMALVLLGEGQASLDDEGKLLPAATALAQAGLRPVILGCKEGLSLTNGTHSVTALAVLAAYDARQAATSADIAASLSLQALHGTIRAYDPRLHAVKQHPEQGQVAENVRRILEDSPPAEHRSDRQLQDPYSLRAIPQMHGAAKRALRDARTVIDEELRSVGDNPILDPGSTEHTALMGANFDGSFVGIQADTMATALAVLAKISERRTDRMVNSHFSGLPAFLTPRPGLHNGYMIPQYTAAALYMEMKAAAHPASVDSVPTSANQEDPVSNAYQAVSRTYRTTHTLNYVLAIELMCAAQALDLQPETRSSPAAAAVYHEIRLVVPTVTEDRHFGPDIEALERRVSDGSILRAVETHTGPLAR